MDFLCAVTTVACAAVTTIVTTPARYEARVCDEHARALVPV